MDKERNKTLKFQNSAHYDAPSDPYVKMVKMQ